MFNHIESDPVKVFHGALDDRLRVSENDDIVVKEEQYKALLVVVVHKKSVVWFFCWQVLVNRVFISFYCLC